MEKKQNDTGGMAAPLRHDNDATPSDDVIFQFSLRAHVVRAIADPRRSIRDLVRCPDLSRPMLAKLVNDFLKDGTLK